ncbi:MAG TPA: beta-ketoacyl synthase N-terminal-like domain-containing protein, partial [Vineibacter sp.]|nr:beta-ketoacyl synthase N-terminal-like domain-containing protein [Vineibacter sp.]
MLDVAITGTGIVSALGLAVDDFHRRLLAGEVAIHPAPWAADGRSAWWGGVRNFVARDWMDAQIEDGTDLFAQFALAAAQQAVQQAGLADVDPDRTGVVHGTSIGGARALMKAQHLLDKEGPQAIPRKTQIQIWPNMAAAQIAMRYQLHGPNLTVTTACASSLDAIGTAARLIAGGQADVVIAGATEGGTSRADGGADGDFVPALFHTSTLYGMDAPANDPRRAIMPFDAKRKGIV